MKLFTVLPTIKTLKNTAFASDRRGIDVFFCEGVLRLYQRRHCVVVGSDKSGVEQARSRPSEVLSLSDWKYGNADTEIINLLTG